MYIRNARASAWLDADSASEQRAEPTQQVSRSRNVQVRYAARPLETAMGRCIAIKHVSNGTDSERLFVLFQSRYERTAEFRWVPAERILTAQEAARWAAQDFKT
jgi:hypothetical protein